MANTATLTTNLSYVGPDNNLVEMPTDSVSAAYDAQNHGNIDVPDATAAATTYSVPFGAITADATCGYVKNTTGQALLVDLNGAGNAFALPSGSTFTWGFGSPSSTPILSIGLTTTAIQSGLGKVAYHLFGDPA
ncbi:MAG: hypothetical protein E6Q97_20185 [Desulfurellales bacterium]|nr:MAG: hypothetical protein E6Q97_20185 [Desulfurellales bacterium]